MFPMLTHPRDWVFGSEVAVLLDARVRIHGLLLDDAEVDAVRMGSTIEEVLQEETALLSRLDLADADEDLGGRGSPAVGDHGRRVEPSLLVDRHELESVVESGVGGGDERQTSQGR